MTTVKITPPVYELCYCVFSNVTCVTASIQSFVGSLCWCGAFLKIYMDIS